MYMYKMFDVEFFLIVLTIKAMIVFQYYLISSNKRI